MNLMFYLIFSAILTYIYTSNYIQNVDDNNNIRIDNVNSALTAA